MKKLTLTGYIGEWDNMKNTKVSQFLQESKGDDVMIDLHSFGGEGFEGNLIYHTLNNYSGQALSKQEIKLNSKQ